MISKTRKNRKNKISKKRKIYGGGEIFSWNLGPLILKKEKGNISDTYWIEYPTDPIQNGWTQLEPTSTNPVPKYICSETVKPPKEEYTWSNLHSQNSIMEKSIFVRPQPDGSFEKSTCHDGHKYCLFDENKHNKKLSEQLWKKSMEIPNTRIKGKKEFIRNFHDVDKQGDKKWDKKWEKKPLWKNLYNILIGLLPNYRIDVPSEFIDLYQTVLTGYWKITDIEEFARKKIDKWGDALFEYRENS